MATEAVTDEMPVPVAAEMTANVPAAMEAAAGPGKEPAMAVRRSGRGRQRQGEDKGGQ